MRFKIHKRNVLAFLLATLMTLGLLTVIRKKVRSNGENVTTKVASESYNDDAQYASSTSKFQYGTVLDMKRSVYESNYRQVIQNAKKFPADHQLVVVVQVHNRPAYLRMLIGSLESVSDVHSLLLIFSLDYFSEEIASIIQGITFCKVLQIYFPYSSQLYPNEFPGQDPKDCPRDLSKEDAIKRKCTNAEYPDSYGHYREAAYTQAKHHWWWKLHFVWERVHALQGYSGHVVFIEEDNYLLPDFYHFLKRMAELKRKECEDCDVLVLGNHDSNVRFGELSNKVETSGWVSTRHNMGMAMSKQLYYKLMGCNAEFCTYDDYNWDWTLQHLSGTCVQKPLKVLATKAPRVLHTGNCGLHRQEGCRPEEELQKVREVIESARASLFPTLLVVDGQQPAERKNHMKNGGWGDIRDHTLCKNYAQIL